MTQRIASDNDAVRTYRGTLERIGRTAGVQVVVPDDVELTEGLVRVSLDDAVYHAPVETDLLGRTVVRGAYRTAQAAREPDAATDHLAAWTETADASVGGSVLIDVLTTDFNLGLRAPGQRVVYRAVDPPDTSLSSIADDLDDE